MGGNNEFALAVSVLNEHEPWCLIGGLAVNCYVSDEHSWDAEIVVAASEFKVIKENLAAAGFSIEEFPSSAMAKMKGGDLEIHLTTDPRRQKFLSGAKLMGVLGERVPVASPTNITLGLIWSRSDETRSPAKRKKDEWDLKRLLESYPELSSLKPEEQQPDTEVP